MDVAEKPNPTVSAMALPGLLPASADFHLGPTATAAELFPITGLSDSDLRNLGNTQRPPGPNGEPMGAWIPKPIKNHYPTIETIRGWNDYCTNRQEKLSGFPVYPSMDAAATAIGCSKNFLRSLKKGGCPGFDNSGRVYTSRLLAGLEEWLAGKTEKDQLRLQAEGVSSWQEFKEKYQGLNEFAKNLEATGKVIERQNAAETAHLATEIFFNALNRLKVNLPALAGKSAADLKHFADRFDRETRKATARVLEDIEKQVDAQLAAQQQQGELIAK